MASLYLGSIDGIGLPMISKGYVKKQKKQRIIFYDIVLVCRYADRLLFKDTYFLYRDEEIHIFMR